MSELGLQTVLFEIGPLAVAVSGGVDSLTLAHVAHQALGHGAEMFHAVSPAVPREATERVQRHAESAGWSLRVVDAGETSDERYRANPVDRCFFCKTNLYGFIAGETDRTIVSGTNTDDLGDYRPGLLAASDHHVRHPFVEAGLDKGDIRGLAHHLGLEDIADLPAAPCLASRIETGLRVTTKRLSAVDAVERFVRERLQARDIRCRIRASGVVIEVDAALVQQASAQLHGPVHRLLADLDVPGELSFAPYERGAAFLTDAGS